MPACLSWKFLTFGKPANVLGLLTLRIAAAVPLVLGGNNTGR